MVPGLLTQPYTELGIPIWLITIAMIWSLIWKGLALWKSARLKQPIWFIVLLVVNTLGILEILYIFLFSKMFPSSRSKKPATKKKTPKKKAKK